MTNWICCYEEYIFRIKRPFRANQNEVITNFAVVMSAVIKRVDCATFSSYQKYTETIETESPHLVFEEWHLKDVPTVLPVILLNAPGVLHFMKGSYLGSTMCKETSYCSYARPAQCFPFWSLDCYTL